MLPTDRSVQWSAGRAGVSRLISALWITSYGCPGGRRVSSVPLASGSDAALPMPVLV